MVEAVLAGSSHVPAKDIGVSRAAKGNAQGLEKNLILLWIDLVESTNCLWQGLCRYPFWCSNLLEKLSKTTSYLSLCWWRVLPVLFPVTALSCGWGLF